MTKSMTLEGRTFNLRGLKRGEVKRLHSETSGENTAEEIDRILELVGISADDLDEMLNSSVLELYYTVLELTFPKPADIKNSKAPSA